MLRQALAPISCALVLAWVAPWAHAEDTTPATAASESTAAAATDTAPSAEAAKPETTQELGFAVDNLFLLLFAVLVIFMQPGFAMVESGFNAAKNTVNILFKNVMDLCIGVLLFWMIGYGLMYPGGEYDGGYFGFAGFGISEKYEFKTGDDYVALHPQADWLFQVAFAATAATIVSGAVAGRMKFVSYLIYSAVITGLVYPISGMWKWGGGWLGSETAGLAAWFGAPFHDFAGSLVVHAVGGFAGLAGAIVLGPRLGRFGPDGKPHAMPGHNMPIAALGVFILWVGWYGFNPGSQLAFQTISDASATVLIAANTTLAAAAGGFAAMLTAWVLFKKPDLTMALNGILAGLVGITANCDQVSNKSAIIIGLVAGLLVVLGILALDRLRIDDPVGAFPVHGLCGVWGGLATGIFGVNSPSMMSQLVGSLVIPLWAFVTMFVLFSVLKAAGILRVSPEEETQGLDIHEHGMEAYWELPIH